MATKGMVHLAVVRQPDPELLLQILTKLEITEEYEGEVLYQHQVLIHAKCCSSVPVLVLFLSVILSLAPGLPLCLPPAALVRGKKSEVSGSREDSHWCKGK